MGSAVFGWWELVAGGEMTFWRLAYIVISSGSGCLRSAGGLRE